MVTKELKLSFTPEQIRELHNADLNIILAQSVNNEKPNIVWQVIKPQEVNSISWKEEYGLYTSNSNLVKSEMIIPTTKTEILVDRSKLYNLETSNRITAIYTKRGHKPFTLLNSNRSQYNTMIGLYADATINGKKIKGNLISASIVPRAYKETMTPSNKIYVWIQSNIKSNVVINYIPTPIIILDYNRVNSIEMMYDSYTGDFLPKVTCRFQCKTTLNTYV